MLAARGQQNSRQRREAYLRSLEKADRQACGAMLRAVQDYGLDAPGVEKRQLEGKLWELKPDPHRLMYVMVAGPTMVVVHGCKKEGGEGEEGRSERRTQAHETGARGRA